MDINDKFETIVRTGYNPRMSLSKGEYIFALTKARAACNRLISRLYPLGERLPDNYELRQSLYDLRQELDNLLAGERE